MQHTCLGLWASFGLWGLVLRASTAAKAARRAKVEMLKLEESGAQRGKEGQLQEAKNKHRRTQFLAEEAIADALRAGCPAVEWNKRIAPPQDIPTESELLFMLQEMVRYLATSIYQGKS